MEFNLADLFECVADAVADREAVVCDDRRCTYSELDSAATRAAHALSALGVRPGEHVGLFLYNCIEFLELMLACFKIRAVPINLNYRYVADELALVGADADLVAIACQQELRPVVDAAAARIPTLHSTIVVDTGGYPALLAEPSPARDFGPRSPGDHYILYTGGTTGHPKGVVWRHDDIFFTALGSGNPGGDPIAEPEQIAAAARTSRSQRVRPYLPPGDPGPDRFAAMALGPLMHAGGQWLALGTLLGGGTVVLNADRHFRVERVLELVQRERLTMVSLVGDATALPLVELLEARPGHYDTSSLLMLGSGGAMLSAGVKTRLLRALPSILVILEAIGSSEAPVQAVSIAQPGGEVGASLQFANREQTMVVDDDLQPILPGSGRTGRLATRGRVPIGYYKDRAKSDATFVTIDGARWSLPGDMARQDPDGTIHLLGRGSMCINTGGEKVYPEEVEAVLKDHPLVADAVVVGVVDHRWGEQVVALIQASLHGGAPTLEELQVHCRERLAGYKAPRAMALTERVERTPAGKPDYTWARHMAATSLEAQPR